MPLEPGEALVVLRQAVWRCLVPSSAVSRVHSAVMPVALPAGAGESRYAVQLEGELMPVLFAAALFGATHAELRSSDKVVVLDRGGRRVALWVDAVEDLAAFEPRDPAKGSTVAGPYFAQLSGTIDPLAVLEVGALLDAVQMGET